MKKRKIKEIIYTAASFVGGAALFGISMNMFLAPGNVVMGGATGIATTVNYLFDSIPIGILILAINIPLLALNLHRLGVLETLKTLAGIVVSSIAIDLMTFLPVTLDDPLLCAVLGGVTMGAGAGLMLTRGFSTGGSDLAAMMLQKRIKSMTTGRILLIIDAVIVISSAFVMRNYETVIYSAVSIFSYSTALDAVMNGSDREKLALIISDKYEKIADEVVSQLDRGVTVFHAGGWYSKEEKEVLMCVVKRQEVYILKNLVEKLDPAAFMIMADATEVLGEGFKSISGEKKREKTKLFGKKKGEKSDNG